MRHNYRPTAGRGWQSTHRCEHLPSLCLWSGHLCTLARGGRWPNCSCPCSHALPFSSGGQPAGPWILVPTPHSWEGKEIAWVMCPCVIQRWAPCSRHCCLACSPVILTPVTRVRWRAKSSGSEPPLQWRQTCGMASESQAGVYREVQAFEGTGVSPSVPSFFLPGTWVWWPKVLQQPCCDHEAAMRREDSGKFAQSIPDRPALRCTAGERGERGPRAVVGW